MKTTNLASAGPSSASLAPSGSNSISSSISSTAPRKYIPYESHGTRVLWSVSEPKQFTLEGGGANEERLYQGVMEVRRLTDSRWPEQQTSADFHSDHFCIWAENQRPVACVSVARPIHGPIFLQEYFPEVLFDHFFDRIMAAYRFRVVSEFRMSSPLTAGIGLARTLTREVWREQIAKGVGIDIIDVEPSYVRYYQRLGYVYCEGCDFICPVFNEPIAVLVLPADSTRPSVIRDLVKDRDDNVFLRDVLGVLNRKVFAVPGTK